MHIQSMPDWTHTLWRIKGTLLIQVVIISIGFWTKDMSAAEHAEWLQRLGFDYQTLLDDSFWHLLTGTWIQSSPGIELSMIVLVFASTVSLELLSDTSLMLLTCITGDWVSTLLTALTTQVLVSVGDANPALLTTSDAGSSAMAHAAFGAAVMLLPRRWVPAALVILIVLTVTQLLYIDLAAAIAHCLATLYGVLIGWFVLRPRLDREGRLWRGG